MRFLSRDVWRPAVLSLRRDIRDIQEEKERLFDSFEPIWHGWRLTEKIRRN